LGQQAAEALEHAHQNGVVHRDVKPANLLLDHRGTLWVTDFGLAQVAHAGDVTQPGDVVGTYRYMSPEQAAGRAVVLDQRTDVYSLGVTLYEFLTLHRAVPGETREELLRQILEVDPRPPRSIDRTVPPELETILGKAMAKGPDDRYQSAQEMADDLRRFLHDEPIRARRPSRWDRAVKWTRRHRALSLAAIAVLLVVAAAMTVTAALTAREQGKTRAAYERERQRAAEAERRGKQARDAVKFFTTFAAREMPLDQQFVALRRRMLEEGLAYYQTFLAERADDPAAAAELASAKAWTETALAELAAVDELGRQMLELRLAADPGVQADLAMSAAQRAAVADAVALAVQVMRAGPPDFTNMTPEQLRSHLIETAEAQRAALAKVVTAAQLERLHQISRQARGVAALSDPDVAAAVALAPAQRTALHAAEAELRRPQLRRHNREGAGGPDGAERAGEPFGFDGPDGKGGPGGRGGPSHGFDDRRRTLLESLVAGFTPAQRAAYEKLVGRPYPNALAFDDRPGFGGPPGGSGGPGGPGGPGRGRGKSGGFDGRPPPDVDRDRHHDRDGPEAPETDVD
ncbi:MAG TPA: serine/threonine-protein kinase, partial [Humisphaera sp.]